MIDPKVAAFIYIGLMLVVVAFQIALALGAPWGEWAMGRQIPWSVAFAEFELQKPY